MRGYHSYTVLAAGINAAMSWESVGKLKGGSHTVRDALDWLDEHETIVYSVEPTRFALRKPLNYWSGSAVAIHYRMAQLSPSDSNYFWEVLGNGGALPGTEPILMLRERIIAEKRSVTNPITVTYAAAITIKAWNAWLVGERPKILRWSPGLGEEFPTLINPKEL
jgi:hypothetical protein